MNLLKHMEAVFLATLAIAGPASVVLDALPDANAKPATTVVARAPAPAQAMPVVVISAKRMTAEEKLQSLQEESAQDRLAARGSI